MLPLLKRHEIQVLLRIVHDKRKVAELAGVCESSVHRIALEGDVTSADDVAERKRRRLGRPSKVEMVKSFVEDLLAKEPKLMSLEVLRRARREGYTGGKTALYALVSELRPKDSKPVTRFEGLPGEFSQHDFGHVRINFIDGASKQIHFFASRLKYSRYAQVTIVPDEGTETLVRRLLDHFSQMGGIPLMGVFDRPKTVAIKWDKDGTVTQWNATFAAFALDLGLGIELCWPYSGNQKGSIESIVKWVKGSFFKQRRFVDEDDLHAQLDEWLHEANHVRPCRATNVIPSIRLEEERPRLRPLRILPADLALKIPVYVNPVAKVLIDTNTYSMPPDSIGMPGTLYLHRDRVRIVAGRFDVTHARLTGQHQDSTLAEHRAQMVAAVSGKRAKRYLKRQHLLDTGPAAWSFLTELLHRRPRQWLVEIDRLHELLQVHGPRAMQSAFEAALDAGAFGLEYVVHFLRERVPPAARVSGGAGGQTPCPGGGGGAPAPAAGEGPR